MNDVIIIGGGPAGMTAAIYAARAGLKTLLIEKMFCGGQAATTYEVENYPGFDKVGGPELAQKMEHHAKAFGTEVIYGEISNIEIDENIKKVFVGEHIYSSKTIILAMGAEPRLLGLEGEKRLRGSGVSYCATCDGMFFKDKIVAVVGGGNAAAEEALYLAQICQKVYLIHRRNVLRADKILVDAIEKNDKVEMVWDSTVEEIEGQFSVEGLQVKNVKSGETSKIQVNGLFVAIGTVPNNELINEKIQLNENGYALTTRSMETNISGVFAAGDIREKPLRQIITAASDGAIAATQAANYIASGK